MLKRLARVVWWLGTLSLFVTAVSLLNSARLEYRATMAHRLKTELGRIHAKESALVSRYVPRSKATQKGALPPASWEVNWDAHLGDYSGALKDVHAPAAAQRECAALEARATAISKELDGLRHTAAEAEFSALIALIAGVAGIVIWAIAYVLGGRFWRPPSTS